MEPIYFYLFVLPLGLLVFLVALLMFYSAAKQDRQHEKMKKMMSTYVRDRAEQEKNFAKQLEKLEALLRDKSLDKDTYARMKEMLEIAFAK